MAQDKTLSGKPSLFIGSSLEGLEIARAIELQLRYDAEVTVWPDGYELSKGTLDNLVSQMSRSDFAVLVLRGDDLTHSRGTTLPSPRDNILFELGLFMGGLDRKRTFIVQDSSQTIKLPSDLFSITPAEYDGKRSDRNWNSAVGPACTLIRERIKALGARANLATFSSGYETILHRGCNVSRFWAQRRYGRCSSDIARLINREEFEYWPEDHDSVMDELFGQADADYQIYAVSYNEVSDWKSALLGARYADVNAQAVARGAFVERIFIYRDLSELNELSAVLDSQRSKKIETRVADAHRLDSNSGQLDNLLIFKIEKPHDRRRYVVWPTHSIQGVLIKALVSWDKAKCDDFQSLYAVIKTVSKAWTPRLKRSLLGPSTRTTKAI